MSIDATNWAWGLQNLSSSEKLVLLSLADRAGENHEAWPSWARLIHDTCLNRKTIFKVLFSLQEKGLIIKTGEKKRQVYVYRLMGIAGRDQNLSTTSTKNGTSINKTTSTKIGTSTSTKIGTSTSTKIGTQNHQLNPKRNPKGETSSFTDFKTQVQNQVQDTGKKPLETLVEQVIFYAEESKGKRDPIESLAIAINLIKTGKWKTPHGFKGFSFKDVVEADEKHERMKQEQIQADAIIGREIAKIVLSKKGLDNLKQLRLITGAQECPQSQIAKKCFSK